MIVFFIFEGLLTKDRPPFLFLTFVAAEILLYDKHAPIFVQPAKNFSLVSY